MAVLWLFVFVVLCKGLRSYGKIVLGLMVVPLIGLTTLCTKMLTMINSSSLQVKTFEKMESYNPNSIEIIFRIFSQPLIGKIFS